MTKSYNLEEMTWQDIREKFAIVNPELAKIIDNISPGKDYTLFRATYPYGSEIVKNGKFNLLIDDTRLVSLLDSEVDSKLQTKLGYNIGTNPVAMILNNSAEIFINLSNTTIPLYGLIRPGKIFSTWRVLNPQHSYAPAFIWDMTAGARSIFMLPTIYDNTKNQKLAKLFECREFPTTLHGQWKFFVNLYQHENFQAKWFLEIVYFPKKWFVLLFDQAWKDFYLYLLQTAWRGSEYLRNKFIWDIALSIIHDYNYKPNPYLADTAKHLLAVSAGVAPAFGPAVNDIAAPIARLKYIYEHIYDLKNHSPIIMQPQNFNWDENEPVYYSLAYPTTVELSARTNNKPSNIKDLLEIKYILSKYLKGIESKRFRLNDTPIDQIPKSVEFSFFHHLANGKDGIFNSIELARDDTRFGPQRKFPLSCNFLRGCIRIRNKM